MIMQAETFTGMYGVRVRTWARGRGKSHNLWLCNMIQPFVEDSCLLSSDVSHAVPDVLKDRSAFIFTVK
jgi:hypothetical protein